MKQSKFGKKYPNRKQYIFTESHKKNLRKAAVARPKVTQETKEKLKKIKLTKVSSNDIKNIIQLYKQEVPVNVIANKYPFSTRVVYRILKENGIELRRVGRPNGKK